MITWTVEAEQLTEVTLKGVPFCVRVSVANRLRAEAEKLTPERGSDVERGGVEEVTVRYTPGR